MMKTSVNALDNLLNGNDASNLLRGMASNDTLHGGAGADTMLGGSCNAVNDGKYIKRCAACSKITHF